MVVVKKFIVILKYKVYYGVIISICMLFYDVILVLVFNVKKWFYWCICSGENGIYYEIWNIKILYKFELYKRVFKNERSYIYLKLWNLYSID